jgi:hypothetical protein
VCLCEEPLAAREKNQWLDVVVVLLELLKQTSAQTTAPAITAPPSTHGFTPKIGAPDPAAGPAGSSWAWGAVAAGASLAAGAGASLAAPPDAAPPDAAPPEGAPTLWSCAICAGDAVCAEANSAFALTRAAAAATAIHVLFTGFPSVGSVQAM